MAKTRKPKLAVWKFASCDGCQLSILDCEDELLAVAGRVEIAYFPEATTAMADGPYDVSLVEGSITTEHDIERIHEIRRQSRLLVTIGACATAGGVQALRNGTDIEAFTSIVYAQPSYIEVLGESTPIADHVEVDLELRGCPIDPGQLVGEVFQRRCGFEIPVDPIPGKVLNQNRWHPCLSGNSLGKKGLACSRRANQKHALGNPGSELDVFLRSLQEINHFLKFLFLFRLNLL